MKTQDSLNYDRIAKAIHFLKQNFKNQPGLDEVAEQVHLSPFHFQRLFTDWAGVSPKKFLQYLSVDYAKGLLREKQASLFDAAHETGLSGTGRLHDLFVNIEGMTPGEFRNGGGSLAIRYSFRTSPFGDLLIASTAKGVCHLAFISDEQEALLELKKNFPNARLAAGEDAIQQAAMRIFQPQSDPAPIQVHLKGTDFQLKVWEALLKIPSGSLCSYGSIAGNIGRQTASRAVGTAIGDNPVAFIIPCHRVIQATGRYGEYRWGSTRKSMLIGWEAAQIENTL